MTRHWPLFAPILNLNLSLNWFSTTCNWKRTHQYSVSLQWKKKDKYFPNIIFDCTTKETKQRGIFFPFSPSSSSFSFSNPSSSSSSSVLLQRWLGSKDVQNLEIKKLTLSKIREKNLFLLLVSSHLLWPKAQYVTDYMSRGQTYDPSKR